MYPLVRSFYLALTKYNGLTDPIFIGFGNFRRLFTVDPAFWPSLRATGAAPKSARTESITWSHSESRDPAPTRVHRHDDQLDVKGRDEVCYGDPRQKVS
ncbi:sugar ABC transporter permease [Kribbella caucasensis]|uniref:sugar ABC transporter permease n=1 Tax=Kribbella caucasensis TaxID=2512215 RepID=UPI00192D9392|nr:sugar ABC transporter permease [Kribbella sp. VKM Ac-2527]